MRKSKIVLLFLLIGLVSNAQDENLLGVVRKPNHRIEAKLEQTIIGNAIYPNANLGFNFEFLNFKNEWSIYAGSGAKINFNSGINGLYIGPDIGISSYFSGKNNYLFVEADINFMIYNFDKITSSFSDNFGINLGFAKRYENFGYSLFGRFERNYILSKDYYRLGVSVFVNFRW